MNMNLMMAAGALPFPGPLAGPMGLAPPPGSLMHVLPVSASLAPSLLLPGADGEPEESEMALLAGEEDEEDEEEDEESAAIRGRKSRAQPPRLFLTKLQQLRMCEQLALHPMKRAELAAWAQREFDLPKAPTLPTVTRVLQSYADLKALPPDELLKPAPNAGKRRYKRRARAPTKYPERTRLTKAQQLQMCEYREAHPDMKHPQLAAWAQSEFKLLKEPTRSTVSKIVRRHDELRALSSADLERRSARTQGVGQLEEHVLAFVALQKSLKQPLSGSAILAAAEQYADLLELPADKRPSLTKSWLYKFQTRHGLSLRKGFKKATK